MLNMPQTETDDANPDAIMPRVRSDVLTDEAIEEVVDKLHAMQRVVRLGHAMDIGALIVDKVYGGELQAIHTKGRKDMSFRRLAAHPRLPCSSSTLWRCVRVYELVRRIPDIVKWEVLTVTHLVAVLGLPHQAQENLLRRAAEQHWTVEHLREVAKQGKRTVKEPDGPPTPLARSVRRLQNLRRRLEDLIDRTGSVDEAEAAQLLELVLQTRTWCDALAARLSPKATTSTQTN